MKTLEETIRPDEPETRRPGWHRRSSHNPETDVLTEILERVERNIWTRPATNFVICRIEDEYMPDSEAVIAKKAESWLRPDGVVIQRAVTIYLPEANKNNPLKRTDTDEVTDLKAGTKDGRKRIAYFDPDKSGVIVATESNLSPLQILNPTGYQNYLRHAAGLAALEG